MMVYQQHHSYQKYSIKDKKHELLSKIRIIDDLIPDYDSVSYRKRYDFMKLECNYTVNSKLGTDLVYPAIGNKIEIYADLILPKLNYGTISRVDARVFLVSDNQSPFKEVKHIDDTCYSSQGYTLSYHVMGENNCGGTSFYEDFHKDAPLLQVPFKENRLVIFPACIPHTGYTNPGYMYNSKRVIFTLFTILNEV